MRVEAVEATTADGVTLRGELVQGDATWCVLVHDEGEDIDAWRALRPGLVAQGWTVLALDLRGHGGSDGDWDASRGLLDVDLPVTLARRSGATHVCVFGVGLGGLLALQATERALAEPGFALADSLVLISPGPLDGLDPMTLRGQGLAKLILSGGRDPGRADADALQRASIGWTLGVTVGTELRGSALVERFGSVVLDKVGTFLREQAAGHGPGVLRLLRERGEEPARGQRLSS